MVEFRLLSLSDSDFAGVESSSEWLLASRPKNFTLRCLLRISSTEMLGGGPILCDRLARYPRRGKGAKRTPTKAIKDPLHAPPPPPSN